MGRERSRQAHSVATQFPVGPCGLLAWGRGVEKRSRPQGAVGAGRRRLSRPQQKKPGRAEPSFSWVLSVGNSLGRAWALPSFPSQAAPFRPWPEAPHPQPPAVNDFSLVRFPAGLGWRVILEGDFGSPTQKLHKTKQYSQRQICTQAAKQPALFPRPSLSAGFPGFPRVGFLQKPWATGLFSDSRWL